MKKETIHIFINGNSKLVDNNIKLNDLLKCLKIDTKGIAIEINKEIVPKSKYNNVKLCVNDKVEVVQFIGGG